MASTLGAREKIANLHTAGGFDMFVMIWVTVDGRKTARVSWRAAYLTTGLGCGIDLVRI